MFLKLLSIVIWFMLVTSVALTIICSTVSAIEWLGLRHFESIDYVRSCIPSFTQYSINMMVGVLWIKYHNTVEASE